jgi:probable rRNA maturation factor
VDLDLDFTLVADVPLPAQIDEAVLADVARRVLESECAEGPWEVAVALVDDARLQALHRDYMGIDSPTDIMTFPLGEPGGAVQGGDLVISLDQAVDQAEELGTTLTDEVEFLVVHGLLHLLGWRDETEAGRQAMLERQRELLGRVE